jgi:hypothetical protein
MREAQTQHFGVIYGCSSPLGSGNTNGPDRPSPRWSSLQSSFSRTRHSCLVQHAAWGLGQVIEHNGCPGQRRDGRKPRFSSRRKMLN